MRPRTPTPTTTVGHAIIGRDAELNALERFLDAVPHGPAVLVIEGEAGIGKTVLWLESVRAAQARAYRVLQARPAENEAQLSYAALADLLGGAADQNRTALPPPPRSARSRSRCSRPIQMKPRTLARSGRRSSGS